MIDLDIQGAESFARIQTILKQVPGGVEKAMRGVISRATSSARTTTLRGITSVYHIESKDVRDRRHSAINAKTRSVQGGVVGQITYSGVKIPLYRFGITPTKPTQGATVRARRRRDKPMRVFEKAFIAKMGSGHTGAFERKGKKRLPIGENMGMATAQMAADEDVLEKVENEAVKETIVKRTEDEISKILNSFGGKL